MRPGVFVYTIGAISGCNLAVSLGSMVTCRLPVLNPAVAIAMGQALSHATWATLLSNICFSLLFMLYEVKQKPAEEDTANAQLDVPFKQLRSVPRAK